MLPTMSEHARCPTHSRARTAGSERDVVIVEGGWVLCSVGRLRERIGEDRVGGAAIGGDAWGGRGEEVARVERAADSEARALLQVAGVLLQTRPLLQPAGVSIRASDGQRRIDEPNAEEARSHAAALPRSSSTGGDCYGTPLHLLTSPNIS